MGFNGEILKFERLLLGHYTSYLLQIWDAAYLHGDQWVQGIVVVIATETWNFIFAE